MAQRLDMKMAGGGRGEGFAGQMNVDAFMEQAHEYAATSEGLDIVYKILSTLALTHPMHTVRAAELQRWVRQGDYDRILRGEYVRRGPETADRPLRDDFAAAGTTTPTRRGSSRAGGRRRQAGRRAGARRLPQRPAVVKLLVVGGGGREHALCWALRREDPDADLYCAPGNPGTAELATNLPIAADDLDRLADAADMHGIDLTVVGPEVPLARGLADRLRAEGRAVFGPSAAAAQIEASKAFAKEVMAAAGVPTAASRTFPELGPALAYVAATPSRWWSRRRASPPARAPSCATRGREAAATVRAMLGDGSFGDAGRTVVIEAFLEGEELSVLAITDGREVELLPASQDHKRLLEGDRGPNTGGMGAYSPVSRRDPRAAGAHPGRGAPPDAGGDAEARHAVQRRALRRADGRRARARPGWSSSTAGSAIPRPRSSCRSSPADSPISRGKSRAEARPRPLELVPGAASVTTVLAAAGYPEHRRRARPSRSPAELPDGVTVFHAGTARDRDGVLRVNGGRVLNVTAVAPTFAEAQRRAATAAEAIQFEGKMFRRDIGWREAASSRELPARAHLPFTFRAQCPSSPKSKPSFATSAPPCSAAASSASRLSHDDVLRGVTRRRLRARTHRGDRGSACSGAPSTP